MKVAGDHLENIPGWDVYLDAVSQTIPLSKLLPITMPLSTFTGVWYMQQVLRQLEENDEYSDLEEVVFVEMPLVKKLRKRNQGRWGIPQVEPQTPTRPRAGRLFSPFKKLPFKDSPILTSKKSLAFLFKEAVTAGSLDVSITTPVVAKSTSPSSYSYTLSPPTHPGEPDTDYHPSDDDEDDEKKNEEKTKKKSIFPRESDENNVNVFSVTFNQAVKITTPGMAAHWSFTRVAFKVEPKKGAKIYEVRTDGHLFIENRSGEKTVKKTRVILEVKPFLRSKSNRVRMQETAQLAAWIHAEPDILDGNRNQRFCRLLFAQNWDAMYLVLAVYDREYMDYMTNEDQNKECNSFLKVRELGPFYIHVRKDVKKIASIIKAITLLFSRGGNLHPPAEA
ncbi:uncharacterized protein BDV14DRAFT_204791 [Aspergillus stella-maris]|uniref:uncharacterized protein n=1 Tax=Aspergillus stella-maris TaxID=1810926 RepID=UPI003CCD8544